MRKITVILIIIFVIFTFACIPEAPVETTTTTTILSSQSDLDKVIAYKAVGSDATYYVFINSDKVVRGFKVAEGLDGAVCIVDANTAGTTAISNPVGVSLSIDKKTVYLDPLTSAIFKK